MNLLYNFVLTNFIDESSAVLNMFYINLCMFYVNLWYILKKFMLWEAIWYNILSFKANTA